MMFLLFAALDFVPAPFPPLPVPALIVRPPPTNHPYHLFVTWDKVPGYPNYRVYWGTNNEDFTRAADSPGTNVAAVSNLWPSTSYQISAVTVASNTMSDFCPALIWPYARTNFFHVFAGANLITVQTNPPDPSFYRARYFPTSTNTLQVQLHRSTNLFNWETVPNLLILLTNKPANLLLRLAVTNNLDAYYHPD